MKKIIILILAAVMSFSLTACSANSPDKTVKGMMDSVKSWDLEAMKKYMSADVFYSKLDDADAATSAAMMKLFVANMTYKITDTKVTGNTATVNLDITNVNMKPVFQDMFSQLMALALSGVDLSDQKVAQEKMLEILAASVDKHKADTVTNNVSLTLTKGKDGWVFDNPSNSFIDALLGGFISAAQDTSSVFNSEE